MADTRRSMSSLQTLFADNTTGDISAQDGRDFIVSVDQENQCQTNTFANEPSSGQLAGDLFLPSNGFYVERYSGSAWTPWGPIFPMTAPVNGDFSWQNQGSASVSTTNGGVYLSVAANGGASWRSRLKTAPATPYTITIAFLPNGVGNNDAWGLVWRQSSDGKLVTINKAAGSNSLAVNKWTNDTTFSAAYVTITGGLDVYQPCLFFRATDNGTNRICSISADGQNFITIHTVGRTDFMTANQVGFGVFDNATYDVGLTLLSWKET